MKTLTKAFLGAALLAGSVVAASAPASAQPAYRGDGVYGREYDGTTASSTTSAMGRYYRGGGAWRNTSMCTSPRFGRWRFDPRDAAARVRSLSLGGARRTFAELHVHDEPLRRRRSRGTAKARP